MPKLNKGKITFGSMPEKYRWILEGAKQAVDYIGKESKLTPTERGLKRLALKDIEKVMNYLNKLSK